MGSAVLCGFFVSVRNNLISDRLLQASFRYLGWVCHLLNISVACVLCVPEGLVCFYFKRWEVTKLLQCVWLPHQMLVSEVAWALEGSISIEFNDSSNNLKPIVVFSLFVVGQKCHTLRERSVWMPGNRTMNFIKCLSCLQRKSHGGWDPNPAAFCRTNSQRHNGLFTNSWCIVFHYSVSIWRTERSRAHRSLGEWEGYI